MFFFFFHFYSFLIYIQRILSNEIFFKLFNIFLRFFFNFLLYRHNNVIFFTFYSFKACIPIGFCFILYLSFNKYTQILGKSLLQLYFQYVLKYYPDVDGISLLTTDVQTLNYFCF